MSVLDDKVVLTGDDLAKLGIRLSNPTRLRMEGTSAFPKRLSLAGRRVVYLTSEIRDWIAQRASEPASQRARCGDAPKEGNPMTASMTPHLGAKTYGGQS